MSWTGDESKELRQTEDEVENLRNKEEHEGLAEVTKDAYHCKSHACEVAEGVADKQLSWIPVRIVGER